MSDRARWASRSTLLHPSCEDGVLLPCGLALTTHHAPSPWPRRSPALKPSDEVDSKNGVVSPIWTIWCNRWPPLLSNVARPQGRRTRQPQCCKIAAASNAPNRAENRDPDMGSASVHIESKGVFGSTAVRSRTEWFHIFLFG
jgi:hypothetical protein